MALTFAQRHGRPELGVGVGLRAAHRDAIEASERQPRWVEVLPENYARFGGRPRASLDAVAARMPVITHGVSLSIGGPDPLSQAYLDELARLLERLDAPWFSDHLTFSSAHGVEYQDLVPLPFDERAVEHVVRRVEQVQRFIGLPFALENASYYLRMPGSTMTEAEFVTRVVEDADCGLLLDVNNVYVNATNHGYDAWDFVQAMPLDRVLQLHLAGHHQDGDFLFDTHGAPVPEPVWDLYRRLIARAGALPTLVEWDHDLPSWDRLMDEADRAEAVMTEAVARFEGRLPPAADPREVRPTEVFTRPDAPPPPERLDGFFDAVAPALDGRVPPEDVSARLGLTERGARRLAFYRGLVQGHATRILHLLYDETEAALGREAFARLAERYAATHPMADHEWNATAEAFPAFLEARRSAGDPDVPPWAPELAGLEWDWFAAWSDPAEHAAADDPARVNPTLRWREHTHRTLAWFLADADTRAAVPARGAEAALVLRHPTELTVRVLDAEPRRLLALKIVAEGLDADALAAGGAGPELVASVLAEARELGLVEGARR